MYANVTEKARFSSPARKVGLWKRRALSIGLSNYDKWPIGFLHPKRIYRTDFSNKYPKG